MEHILFYQHLRHQTQVDDTNEFTWWSDRDGWSHYYLYDQDGTLKNHITKGAYSVTRVTTDDLLAETERFIRATDRLAVPSGNYV